MYFIVGKTINQNKQIISYLITDGNSVREVTPQQVYIEFQKGNLSYLKGFNTNTGEVDFKNIDNTLIPTFYNGGGINNSASVLQVLKENGKQIGVRILVVSGEIMNVSLSDTIKLVNNNKIQLFNAKIVNNKIVMKYAGTVTEISRGNKETSRGNKETSRGNKKEVTINNYDKSKFVIDDNLKLIKYTGNDKEVIIPKGVKSIGECAFYDCTNLESVTIPDSVTSIGEEAFAYCYSLTSVTIGNSVTCIGGDAFIDTPFFENDTRDFVIYGKVLYAYQGTQTEVVIPGSVTSIGNSAFYECKNLTSITIPNSVTSIEENAFSRCMGLKSITIPNSVISIGENVFCDCKSLKSIIIPDSVTSIGDDAFSVCIGLESIAIPDSVTSIGDRAFIGCTKLKNINIPDSVESIGKYVFCYWTPSQTIYIKGRSSAPSGWSEDWNDECNARIVWNSELDDTGKSVETSKSAKTSTIIEMSGNCGKNGDNVTYQLDDIEFEPKLYF